MSAAPSPVALRLWLPIMLSLTVVFGSTPPYAAEARPNASEPLVEAAYRLAVRLDPASRRLAALAEITVDGRAPFDLVLNADLEAGTLRVEGVPLALRAEREGDVVRWSLPEGPPGRTVSIEWHGTLRAPRAGTDHAATLGPQPPTAAPEGSFLPSSSLWYPLVLRGGRPLLHAYRLSLDLPEGQRGLAAGSLVSETVRGGRVVAEFAFPHPAEGIDLIAGPYHVSEKHVRSSDGRPIALRTYFHGGLEPLAAGYLDAVGDYLALYERWIGPYPFASFAVVSSPTPTGFGMPTLTYLGIEVLKLPFIKGTSLGHEVLHNWWGNGVYPDYGEGNWSEGLTTFMADYYYAEREGADKARAMRLGWLRDLSGIPPGRDPPLSAFTARTHGVDQAVGYGKAAMLFLMLRDRIGEPAFDRGIRRFWQTQRFRVADWADLRAAFEAESGQRLEAFFAQWLGRTGLAEVSLVASRHAGDRVAVTLSQSVPPYVLEVPLQLDTGGGPALRRVRLEYARQEFELELEPGDTATRVTLDPDSRVLRRLDRHETPPILRELQFDPRSALLTLGEGRFRGTASALAARLLDHPADSHPPDEAPGARPLLVIGEATEVEGWLARHALPPPPSEVAGQGSVRVWTHRLDSGVPIGVVAADSEPALVAAGRPLPHYRQQSWLVLQDGRALARGVWAARPVSVPVTRH